MKMSISFITRISSEYCYPLVQCRLEAIQSWMIWASAWDFQQFGMCDQQSLRPACAYAQSDQSLCLSLEYSMIVKLLTERHLEFLSLKGGCTGSSESTLVKMSNCWKSRALAQNFVINLSVLVVNINLRKWIHISMALFVRINSLTWQVCKGTIEALILVLCCCMLGIGRVSVIELSHYEFKITHRLSVSSFIYRSNHII